MKRWSMLGLSVLVVVVGLSLSPQTLRTARGSEEATLGQQLEGTWLLTVTRGMAPPGEPLAFPTAITFLPGGAFFETPALVAGRTTPGHGQWVRTGDREFRGSFLFFLLDPFGAFVGTAKVTATYTLSEDLQELRVTGLTQILDAEGAILGARPINAVGRRMTIGEIADGP